MFIFTFLNAYCNTFLIIYVRTQVIINFPGTKRRLTAESIGNRDELLSHTMRSAYFYFILTNILLIKFWFKNSTINLIYHYVVQIRISDNFYELIDLLGIAGDVFPPTPTSLYVFLLEYYFLGVKLKDKTALSFKSCR